MTWHDANRMLSPEQWQLALTHVVAAWPKADKTKTSQHVFRKDKLKNAGLGWVVAVELGDEQGIQPGGLVWWFGCGSCPGIVATVQKKYMSCILSPFVLAVPANLQN